MNITPWNRYWEDGTGNGEAVNGVFRAVLLKIVIVKSHGKSRKSHGNYSNIGSD